MFSKNTKYSFKLIFLSLALFSIFRLATLIIAFKNPLVLPLQDIAKAFYIGLRYDINILMYPLILLVVISHLPWVGVERNRFTRGLVQACAIAVLSLASFSLLVDIENMRTTDERFFITDLAYLQDFRDSFEVMLSGFNLLPYILTWLILTVLLFALVRRMGRDLDSPAPKVSIPARIAGPLGLIILILVTGLSGFSVLRWGDAYFSKYKKLNELALNGPYVLYYSYRHIDSETKSGNASLGSGTGEEAAAVTRKLLADDQFSFVPSGESPIMRKLSGNSTYRPRNIILIIMESFSTNSIGAFGAKKSLSPFFDKLAAKGLLFTNFYANGHRTNKGLPAILMSYPDFTPGQGVMRSIAYRHKQFSSLADLFKKKGFFNYYVTGGRLDFDNQDGFMRKHGFDRLVGFTDFNIFTESEKKGSTWTLPDEVIFDHAHETFQELSSNNRQFLGVVLTLSNHRPYMLPAHFAQTGPDLSQEERAFLYSDWALEQFMAKAEKSGYSKNSIFVITADSGLPEDFLESEEHRKFHIPLLLYAPGLIEPGKNSTLGSQVDLMPTLLHLAGLQAPFESFGKSLLAKSDVRFAIAKKDITYHILRDGLYIKTDLMNNIPRVFDLEGAVPSKGNETREERTRRIIDESRMFVITAQNLVRQPAVSVTAK